MRYFICIFFLFLCINANAQNNIEGRHLPGNWTFSYLAKTGPNATDTATVTGAMEIKYTEVANATVQYPAGNVVLKMKIGDKEYSYINILSGTFYPAEHIATLNTGEKPDELKADVLPNGLKWKDLAITLNIAVEKDKKWVINAIVAERGGNNYPIVLAKK